MRFPRDILPFGKQSLEIHSPLHDNVVILKDLTYYECDILY